MSKSHLYIFELTEDVQNQIRTDVAEALQDMPWINVNEEVENAMGYKLCDLTDTIDISKYL